MLWSENKEKQIKTKDQRNVSLMTIKCQYFVNPMLPLTTGIGIGMTHNVYANSNASLRG